MNESKEITILQEMNIKVTNWRMLIGTETYGLSNIRSVKMTRRPRKRIEDAMNTAIEVRR